MKKKISDKTFNLIFSLSALVAMWLIWLIAYRAEGNDYVIPSFFQTVKEGFWLLGEKEFWRSFGYTMLRSVEAFALSFALAALFSSLAQCSKKFGAFFSPFVSLLRTLPTMAIILIILLWSSPRTAPVIVTFLVTFPMVYAQFSAAFGGIDNKLIQMAQVYNLTAKQKIFKIYLPLVLPNVIAQAGAAFSLTLKVMISAEVMANTYISIGGMMQEARSFLQTPRLFALTLITIIVGAVLEWTLGKLKIFTRRWTGEQSSKSRNSSAIFKKRKFVSAEFQKNEEAENDRV